jgi:hypothetical protein
LLPITCSGAVTTSESGALPEFKLMQRRVTRLDPEFDPFIFTTGCILTFILSFGMAVVLFTAKDSDVERDRGPWISLSAANGLRLLFPSSQRSDHLPDRAFDGSIAPDNFWEAPGPFPMELIVDLPQSRTLFAYSLKTGEAPQRMPAEWSLEASEDGTSWSRLDRQKVKPWLPSEARKFPVSPDKPARRLRFQFVVGFDQTILRIYEIELH